MEYEFRRNTLTGTVMASFSMDHEALGFWFVEELGESAEKYAEICQVVAKLQSNQLINWRLVGKALSIELDSEQARVFANELENDLGSFDLCKAQAQAQGGGPSPMKRGDLGQRGCYGTNPFLVRCPGNLCSK